MQYEGEFTRIMTRLADAFDTTVGQDSMTRFWRTLKDFDLQTADHAVTTIIDSGKYSRLPPPASVRAACLASQGRYQHKGKFTPEDLEMQRRHIERRIARLEALANEPEAPSMTERRWADLQNLRVLLGTRFRTERSEP